jgi:hypothetical protein
MSTPKTGNSKEFQGSKPVFQNQFPKLIYMFGPHNLNSIISSKKKKLKNI